MTALTASSRAEIPMPPRPKSGLVAGPSRISRKPEKTAMPKAPSAAISTRRAVAAGRNSGPRNARIEAAIIVSGARKGRRAMDMECLLLCNACRGAES
jgi:hypothetical protein